MLLSFWGTRGSIAAPVSPDHVEQKLLAALEAVRDQNVDLAQSDAIHQFVSELSLAGSTVGGNTTCVTLEHDGGLFIFDAGTGIRCLGEYLMSDKNERVRNYGFRRGNGHGYLFFTHTHWDHVQGLPFFKPLHVPGNVFDVFHVHDHVPQSLADQMDPRYFPLQFDQIGATLNFHKMGEGEQLNLGGCVISNIELKHPGKAYAYRVERDNAVVILATDGEYQSLDNTDTLKYRNFYANADVLIFDSMFSVRESFIKEDWGHSSALIGADIASEAGAKRLLLFHHDPAANDLEIVRILHETREYLERQGKNMEVEIAQEGLEIRLENPTITADFHITDRIERGVIVMSLAGIFGGRATERFKKQLAHSVQSHQSDKVILQMDGVEALHMAGLRALVDARRTVMSLALVGVPEDVFRVIELSGTTDFFAIYDDDESALMALNSH